MAPEAVDVNAVIIRKKIVKFSVNSNGPHFRAHSEKELQEEVMLPT